MFIHELYYKTMKELENSDEIELYICQYKWLNATINTISGHIRDLIKGTGDYIYKAISLIENPIITQIFQNKNRSIPPAPPSSPKKSIKNEN